jgi:Flp pilus assembly protein TadG
MRYVIAHKWVLKAARRYNPNLIADLHLTICYPGCKNRGKTVVNMLSRDNTMVLTGARGAARTRRKRLNARLRKGTERGAALVELALSLPILLLLTTGIATFGIAFNHYLELTDAVSIGARLLSISRNTTAGADPCALTVAAIQNAAPYLNPSSMTFNFTLNGSPFSGKTCTSGSADLVQSQPVTVIVTYPCSVAVYGSNLIPGCQLHAEITELEQ